MNYPSLPFSVVHFLANHTKARRDLRKGPRHITAIAHHDVECKPMRFEVDRDEQFVEVLRGMIQLFSDRPVHTMTLIYPTSEHGFDHGLVLEKNKKPLAFEWQYGGDFNILHINNPAQVEELMRNIGAKEIQGLLDKSTGYSIQIPMAN